MPGQQLMAKVAHWWDTAWLPWDLRHVEQAQAAGAVRPLHGLEEWKFIYAMSRIQRKKKARLPSFLKHYVARLLEEVADVQAPMPLAWLAVHPRGSRLQKAALHQVLHAGGSSLAIPPWIENVPPTPAPPPPVPVPASEVPASEVPASGAPAPVPASGVPVPASGAPAPVPASEAPASEAPAPVQGPGRCLGQCSAAMSLQTHTGCPRLQALTPGRCTNTAQVSLTYEGKPVQVAQQDTVHFLRQSVGKLLVSDWLYRAHTEHHGHVVVCTQCHERITRQLRTTSPLDSLKLGIASLDAAGRSVTQWAGWTRQAMGLAQKVAPAWVKPYVQQGEQVAAQVQQSARQVSPSAQAGEFLTSRLGLQGPTKHVVQSMVSSQLGSALRNTMGVDASAAHPTTAPATAPATTGRAAGLAALSAAIPAGASDYVTQMLQKLRS